MRDARVLEFAIQPTESLCLGGEYSRTAKSEGYLYSSKSLVRDSKIDQSHLLNAAVSN